MFQNLLNSPMNIWRERERANTTVIFGQDRIETDEQRKKRLKREQALLEQNYKQALSTNAPMVFSPEFTREARQVTMKRQMKTRQPSLAAVEKVSPIHAQVGYWLGDVNADIHAYSYGNLLGWTPEYQVAMKQSGQNAAMFDPYWNRIENSSLKDAEKNGTLTFAQSYSMTGQLLNTLDQAKSDMKLNIKNAKEGLPLIPMQKLPNSPEWQKYKKILNGEIKTVPSPLFRTAREFQRGSQLWQKFLKMDDEQRETWANNFPYDYDLAMRAYVTNTKGLPVPGEGMPAIYRFIQAGLYNASIASRPLQGLMHRFGMTSGEDVLGATDNPIEKYAGHAGGVAGMIGAAMMGAPAKATAMAKYGTSEEFLGWMEKAKYLQFGGYNAPFALVDDVFGRLNPVAIAQTSRTLGVATKILQSTAVKRAVGGGLLFGGTEAFETSDPAEIAKAFGQGAAMTAGLDLAIGGIMSPATGGLGWLYSSADTVRKRSAVELQPLMNSATQRARSINAKGGVRNAATLARLSEAPDTELYRGLTEIAELAKSFEELNVAREMEWGIGYRKPGAGLMNFITNIREGAGMLDDMDAAQYSRWETDAQALVDAFTRDSAMEQMRFNLIRPEGSPTWDDYNMVQNYKKSAAAKGMTLKEYLNSEKQITAELNSIGKTQEGLQLLSDFQDAIAAESEQRRMRPNDLMRDLETGHYPFLALGEAVARRAGLDPAVWGSRLAMVSPRVSSAIQSVQMGMAIVSKLDGKKPIRIGSPEHYKLTNDLKMDRAMALSSLEARIKGIDRDIEAGATATYKGARMINDPQHGWILRREAGHETPRQGMWTAPKNWQEWNAKGHEAIAKAPDYLIKLQEERSALVEQLDRMKTDGIHLPRDIMAYKMPELNPSGKFKQGDAIGTVYSELIDKIENPLARTLMRGLTGTIIGFDKPRRGLSLASLGLMGEATDNLLPRIEKELTAVVDEYAASISNRTAGGEKMALDKLLLLPGAHPYDILRKAFNSDLPFLLAKELTGQRDNARAYTLGRFAEVFKLHGKANTTKVMQLMIDEKPIPTELHAIRDDVTKVMDFLAQFVKDARYRQDYVTKIREGVTLGKYTTRLGSIGGKSIDVTYNTPWKLHRTSNEPEMTRNVGNTIITYVDSVFDEFYGKGIAEMFDYLYGTPSKKISAEQTNKGLDDLSGYLVKLIQHDVLNRPTDSTKFLRSVEPYLNAVTMMRYASDLVGNVNTHIKNALQPLLTAAMTGGLENFVATMPYKFHPEMKAVFNDYQHLLVSNYFSDILQQSKQFEAFGNKPYASQQFMEWLSSSYQWVEVNNRAMAFANSLGYQLTKGWKPEEAIPRAVMDVHRSQFMYGRMGSPMLLRENAFARMGFQYSFQYRYLDMAKRVLDNKEYGKLAQLGLSSLIIDYALAPVLFHDEVFLGTARRVLHGEGGQEDLDDLLFGGMTAGGFKDIVPLQGMYPELGAKSIDLSNFNPGAKPLMQALSKLGSSLSDGDSAFSELGEYLSVVGDMGGGNVDPAFYKPLLASDSIWGGLVPGRAALDRAFGVGTRMLSSTNGETYLRAANDDPSRQNIIATLSPMEEMSMLFFGGTPEVDRYWRLRGIEIDADMAGEAATRDLKKPYIKAMAEQLARVDLGSAAEYDEQMREAMTTQWGRVSEESIASMHRDKQLLGQALERAISLHRQHHPDDKKWQSRLEAWHKQIVNSEATEKVKNAPPAMRSMFTDIAGKWGVDSWDATKGMGR